jgi:hypothetical protein
MINEFFDGFKLACGAFKAWQRGVQGKSSHRLFWLLIVSYQKPHEL